jgi:hypothetical protein
MPSNSLIDPTPNHTVLDLSTLSYVQLDHVKHQASADGNTKLADDAEVAQFLLIDKAYRNP